MSVTLQCECGKRLRVKDDLAGKRVKCPSCGHAILVPPLQSVSQPKATTSSPRNRPATSKGKPSHNQPTPVATGTTANSQANELARLREVRIAQRIENKGKEKTEQRGIGCVLMVIGIGSFVIPLLGIQFRVVNFLGPEAAPIIGGLLAVVGLVLFALSYVSAGSGTSVDAVGTGQAEPVSGAGSHPPGASAGIVTTTEPTAPAIVGTQTAMPNSSEECTECLLNPIDTCNICKLSFCQKHGGRRGSRIMCLKCYKKMRLFLGYLPTGCLGIAGSALLFLSFCTKYPEGLYVLSAICFAGVGLIWLAIVFANPVRSR
jgi:DNA-directed RNA polymerase subunit RPC12/RpoP